MFFYTKAAEQGHTEAQFRLGEIYFRSLDDYSKAIYWYKKAANKNHGDAQYMLGRCYEEGKGVSKNKSISKQWYNKARKNNSSYSLWGDYDESLAPYFF